MDKLACPDLLDISSSSLRFVMLMLAGCWWQLESQALREISRVWQIRHDVHLHIRFVESSNGHSAEYHLGRAPHGACILRVVNVSQQH
jgi:hypothetical protein